MSLFDETVYTIKQNKQVKESGNLLAIPFHRMPKLSTILPGVRKGVYTVVTASTKQSKTQLTDFMYVNQPVEYIQNNPDCGLDIRIKYFSLEISKTDKLAQCMTYKLFTDYGIIMNPLNLMSMFQGYTIDKKILDIIESTKFREYFEFFESRVEIIDNISSPTGIMINCETYARENGKVIYEDVKWDDGSVHKIIKEYIPNNPKEIVEVIIDHATLLNEKGLILYDCIKTLSSKHLLKLKNKYNYSPLLVQQQSGDSTTQQFNNRGENVLDKVRPTPEGLAGCKDVRQDCNLMIGMFSPYLYKEEVYEGWDLTRVRDYHRELTILLNRNGRSNIAQQLFFNGACSYFKELPPNPSPETRQNIYKAIDGYRNEELKYTN
jgi:hypothetical protein